MGGMVAAVTLDLSITDRVYLLCDWEGVRWSVIKRFDRLIWLRLADST